MVLAENSNPRTHIGIIGAGLAGLKAARIFEEAGVQYTILEGSSRIGGRVYPFAYESGYLQYGAEYVNGYKNEIYEIVEKLDLLDKTTNRTDDLYCLAVDAETFLNGQRVEGENLKLWNQFLHLMNRVFNEGAWNRNEVNKTVKEKINEIMEEFLKTVPFEQRSLLRSLEKLYSNYFQTEWSSPVNELTLFNFEAWDDGTDVEDSAVLNKYGFQKILHYCESFIPKEKIRLNSKVLNINYEGERVNLKIENGEELSFDHVIVTSSLGFLKKYSDRFFSPHLPVEKQRAIQDMGFGSNMKIFIEFENIWWPEKLSTFMITTTSDELTKNPKLTENLMVFQPSSWVPNILIAWLAGNGPAEAALMTDSELAETIEYHLKQNLASQYLVSKVSKIYRHNWISDEFSLGSYSYLTSKSVENHPDIINELQKPLIVNDIPKVCFAGEHTSKLMYQTTVGAIKSGAREANRLLNFSKK